MIEVEAVTDLGCNAGRRFGAFTVLGGSYSEHVDNSDECSIEVEYDERVDPSLRQVIRIKDAINVVREYRIHSIGQTMADNRRTIKGIGILNDLATAGKYRAVVNGVTVYSFGEESRTPSEFITARVLTNLAADGLSWLSLGTIESTQIVKLTPPVTGWTRLEWLRNIASESGMELRLRRNGNTGYYIDLLTQVGSTAERVPIMRGKNLLTLASDMDAGELATAVTVFGGTDPASSRPYTIGDNGWAVGTASGAGPYWIPLTDPEGGAGPVAFASQFGTATGSQAAYLLRADGGTTQITDSRITPNNAVQVAATTGLTAGDVVGIIANSSGDRLVELQAPNTKRLHRDDTTDRLQGERNYAIDGLLSQWTDTVTPTKWSKQGGLTKVGRFERSNTIGNFTATLTTGGASTATVTVTGAPAGAKFYQGETIIGIPTHGTIDVAADATMDGSGNGTFTQDMARVITSHSNVYCGGNDVRPTAFPTDAGAGAYLLRLFPNTSGTTFDYPVDLTMAHVRGTAITVKYVAGFKYLHCAAGLTLRTPAGTVGDWKYPAVGIRNNSGGALLASSADAGDPDPSTTNHITPAATYTLSADLTVNPVVWGTQSDLFVRYVFLWLSPSITPTVPPPVAGSHGNKMWQRGNRALLARTLTKRQIRVSLRYLSSLSDFVLSRETLTLGGTVPLEDLNIDVRALGLIMSTTDPTDCDVILDAQPKRLTQYLAER